MSLLYRSSRSFKEKVKTQDSNYNLLLQKISHLSVVKELTKNPQVRETIDDFLNYVQAVRKSLPTEDVIGQKMELNFNETIEQSLEN